jgi:hypothetical protein
MDPDRRGITVVSPNPNLGLTGLRHQTGAVVIRFGIPAGDVTVARLRGRYYLRNGYHRVVGPGAGGRDDGARGGDRHRHLRERRTGYHIRADEIRLPA